MYKKCLIIISLVLFCALGYADSGFFLKGRSGVLVKTDIRSGFKKNLPTKKGPTNEEVPREYDISSFEALLEKVDADEKIILKDAYKLEGEKYLLDESLVNEVRAILLKYNKDNEIPSGLLDHGMPMPHRFTRVFNPATKVNIDISFVWGYRFENNVALDFAVNLTNFIMPSLEVGVSYHFELPDEYGFEPYLGGVLYGGFLDGFPIGLSLVTGLDFFPMYETEDDKQFFIGPEFRIGTVWLTEVYFDTGLDSEGIWKEFNFLGEAGFYFNAGYRWDDD